MLLLLSALYFFGVEVVRCSNTTGEVWRGGRVAVVTGGSRGIGYGTVRALCSAFQGTVVLASRGASRSRQAILKLNAVGCYPAYRHLDMSFRRSISEFSDYVANTYGGLDVLINNAALRYPANTTAFTFYDQARLTLRVNFNNIMHLCRLLFPLLRPHARVVNLSDSCGRLSYLESAGLKREFADERLSASDIVALMKRYVDSAKAECHRYLGWGTDPYCVSKLALTALTRVQQDALSRNRSGDDIVVNAFYPGHVRTAMTNYTGRVSPTLAGVNVVWLATLPHNTTSPVGQYVWHDMSVVDWRDDEAFL